MPDPAAQLAHAATGTGTGAMLATSSRTAVSGGSSRPAGAAVAACRVAWASSAMIAANRGGTGEVALSAATRYSVSVLVTNLAKSKSGSSPDVVTARAQAGCSMNFSTRASVAAIECRVRSD